MDIQIVVPLLICPTYQDIFSDNTSLCFIFFLWMSKDKDCQQGTKILISIVWHIYFVILLIHPSICFLLFSLGGA